MNIAGYGVEALLPAAVSLSGVSSIAVVSIGCSNELICAPK
jgi:hypothetical protein